MNCSSVLSTLSSVLIAWSPVKSRSVFILKCHCFTFKPQYMKLNMVSWNDIFTSILFHDDKIHRINGQLSSASQPPLVKNTFFIFQILQRFQASSKIQTFLNVCSSRSPQFRSNPASLISFLWFYPSCTPHSSRVLFSPFSKQCLLYLVQTPLISSSAFHYSPQYRKCWASTCTWTKIILMNNSGGIFISTSTRKCPRKAHQWPSQRRKFWFIVNSHVSLQLLTTSFLYSLGNLFTCSISQTYLKRSSFICQIVLSLSTYKYSDPALPCHVKHAPRLCPGYPPLYHLAPPAP